MQCMLLIFNFKIKISYFLGDAFNNLHLVENLDELSINMGEISVPLEILSQLHQLRILRLYYVAIGRELAFDFHNIQQWPFPEEPSMVQVFSNFNFRQLKKLIIDQDFNQMSMYLYFMYNPL